MDLGGWPLGAAVIVLAKEEKARLGMAPGCGVKCSPRWLKARDFRTAVSSYALG
jgi:hypothetical protein